jgi:S-adenosylmethionine decarboxylase proenzyme
MSPKGLHLIVELVNCNVEKLDNIEFITEAMLDAAEFSGATILHQHFYKFTPQGVSGALILAESHLTIHTWPEHKYAALDFFSCGNKCKPWWGVAYLAAVFEGKLKVKRVNRGVNIGE